MFVRRLTFILFLVNLLGCVSVRETKQGYYPLAINIRLTNLTYVAFDTETTGFHPELNKLIEIGAIKFRISPSGEFEIIDTFQSLIDPGVPIPSFITELTGINNAMVAEKHKSDVVIANFTEFVVDADILVGHNVRFDIHFIGYESRSHGLPFIKKPFLDERNLCLALTIAPSCHGQGQLANDLGYDLNGEHRAEKDSHITGWLLTYEIRQLANFNDINVHELIWSELEGLDCLIDMESEVSRVFPLTEVVNFQSLPIDFRDRIKSIGRQLYKDYESSSLWDIAQEMGVSYHELVEALQH